MRTIQAGQGGVHALLTARWIPHALVILGILLRLRGWWADRSLWLDEALLALNLVSRSFQELWQLLDLNQAAPLGFLLLSKSVLQSLGETERALRLVPLLSGCLSLPLFASLARRVLPVLESRLALLLFAVLPSLVYYSSEAKQYSTDLLVAAALQLSALAWLAHPSRSRLAAYFAMTASLSVWLSYPAVFVIAACGGCQIVRACLERHWRHFLEASAACAVPAISFAVLFGLHTRTLVGSEFLAEFWAGYFAPFPPASPGEWLWYPKAFLAFFAHPVQHALPGVALLCFLGGAVRCFGRDWKILGVLAGPLLVQLVASMFDVYPFGDRVSLYAVPGAVILMGAGLVGVREAGPSARAVALLLAGLLVLPPTAKSFARLLLPVEREELRAVLEELESRLEPADRLYVYHAAIPAYRYYVSHTRCCPRLASQPWEEGSLADEKRDRFREDLDRLEGGRVWLVFSHVRTSSGLDERSVLLDLAAERGCRLTDVLEQGASAHLYDLGRPPSSCPAIPTGTRSSGGP